MAPSLTRPGHDEYIALIHTEVDQEKSVPGLADVRARGLGVLPYCPCVQRTIDRNREEYLDLVPVERRAEFRLN